MFRLLQISNINFELASSHKFEPLQETGEKHWDGRINDCLPSVEILVTSWYSKAFNCIFFMMKRWWYLYFAALLFSFFFKQGSWRSNTESVPILQDGDGKRWNTGSLFHSHCFHACTIFSSGRIFPLSMLVLAWFYSTYDISVIISLCQRHENIPQVCTMGQG